MNIARNHITPRTGDAQGRAGGGAGDGYADLQLPSNPRHIDWQALRLRLFATRERADGPSRGDIEAERLHLRGSFADGAASRLGVYHNSLSLVNLDGSSNGKSVQGTESIVAVHADGGGERG